LTVRRPSVALLAALAAVIVLPATIVAAPPTGGGPVNSFVPIATYEVTGEVAEIVAATPDGRTLVYTDSEEQEIGFVDIADPSAPVPAGEVPVDGVPTSAAIGREAEGVT